MKRFATTQVIFLLLLLEAERPSPAQTQPEESRAGAREFGWSLKPPDKKGSIVKGPERALTGPLSEDDVLRVETNLIVSDALVYDKKGRPVEGLNRGDFRVEEDGAAQNIEFFSNGRDSSIPRSIILIIDYSASQLPYIETSISAAQVLVSMLNPADRMAIVTDDVDLLVGFTSDKALLTERLASLKTRVSQGRVGKSEQFCALMAALNELLSEDDLRPVVIFQTDGDEFGVTAYSHATRAAENVQRRKYTFEEVVSSIERTRVTVYSVVPGPRLNEASGEARLELAQKELEKAVQSMYAFRKMEYKPGPRKHDERFLRQWAKARTRDADAVSRLAIESGGLAEYLERPDQASATYQRILAEMNRRYVIGYYPTNAKRDGKQRKIRITVEKDPGLKIRGKTSYIAGGPPN